MLKITGLVRASNNIRSQLQTGLRPQDVEQFKLRVRKVIVDVEELCRNSGTRPDHLPAPSRMAYRFLKELDLDNLPITHEGENSAKPAKVRIKNLFKIGERIIAGIWDHLDQLISSPDERGRLKQAIEGHVSVVERICQNHNATPAALDRPSRQTYCWLKFLLGENVLTQHLEALQRAKEAINEILPRSKHPIHLHLTFVNALWRKRQYPNAILIKVNQGFLGADPGVWRAIIKNATSPPTPENEKLIREYAGSDDFGELLDEMESFASPPAPPSQGRAHNLDESFDRVNRSYFGGAMAKPKIIWNRTLTLRKFGHYQPSRDTVMISISLDDPAMPDHVIDFVMYHELLHKKHGSTIINGRRQAHSPAFRADERLFHQFKDASHHLHQLALRHRGLGAGSDVV